MTKVVVVDMDELETMYQDRPNVFVCIQICKCTTSKCTVWIYTNYVSIIATNSTKWRYVIVYKVR